jgi:urease accessory protein
MAPDSRTGHASGASLSDLRLLHLADSALPIGALSHSFGLESLVASEILRVSDIPRFLQGYLEEAGLVEAVFCRGAHRLANGSTGKLPIDRWLELNRLLSARKPARESCRGSAALGRNFLEAAIALIESTILLEALAATKNPPDFVHHCAAFGLVSRVIGVEEDRAVAAFLHQSVASLISACQRLLPLGQTEATRILWNLKPTLIEVAGRSSDCSIDDACSFMPLLDWAAMEHPALSTRLFIS